MMSQQHSSKQIPFNALTSAFVCAILHLMSVTALLYCIYFFYCSPLMCKTHFRGTKKYDVIACNHLRCCRSSKTSHMLDGWKTKLELVAVAKFNGNVVELVGAVTSTSGKKKG